MSRRDGSGPRSAAGLGGGLHGDEGRLRAGVTAEGGKDGPDGGVSGGNADGDSGETGEEDGGRDQYGVHVVRLL